MHATSFTQANKVTEQEMLYPIILTLEYNLREF